ncbi:MAG: gamma-glutamylcyclotransferase family protein [Cyclobacteriaceae bacterium]
MENHFYFFSYGSNLLFERIQKRTPSVEVIKQFKIDQFELVFNKRSKDGSTKANIVQSDIASSVYGTIKRIEKAEKKNLDRAEGLGYGYDLEYFETTLHDEIISVGYYIAREEKYLMEGKPYDWYLDYVRFGALQNQFPKEYISMLNSVEGDVDKNGLRRKEHDLVLSPYR